MRINTINNDYLDINYRSLRAMSSSIFSNILKNPKKEEKYNIDELLQKLQIKLGSRYRAFEDYDSLENIIAHLLFVDFKVDRKTQGGYGILLNTIIHYFEETFESKLFSLISGASFKCYILNKKQLLSLKTFIEDNYDKNDREDRQEYIRSEISQFNDFLENTSEDIFYITQDEYDYDLSDGCFDLHTVMSEDELLNKFRKLVLEHEITDLEEIDNYWFNDVLNSEERLQYLLSTNDNLIEDTSPVDSLYFENNYNIVTILEQKTD